jgi:glycosyltransferase involved in cell wall biosynthesis
MKIINVCFFNSNKVWGGGEKWHFQQASKLHALGHRVVLITTPHSDLSKKVSASHISQKSFKIGNLSYLNPWKMFILYRFFKIHQTQVVIFNLPADVKCGGIAAKLAGVPKIIYRRGMPHPLRRTWLNKFLFTKILTDIIANSEEIKNSLLQHNLNSNKESWPDEKKIHVLYNGIDVSTLPPLRSLSVKNLESTLILGNVGRLVEQKNQESLIKLALELKKSLKGLNLKFKIKIAGEGPLKSILEDKIEESQLQNDIELLGHLADVSSFMNEIDIFVFPSLFEGTSNALLEALAYGKPVIAYNVSSNPELIIQGKNGFLVPAFDQTVFAQNVLKLIQDFELRQSMGSESRALIIQKFKSEVIFEQFLKIIQY